MSVNVFDSRFKSISTLPQVFEYTISFQCFTFPSANRNDYSTQRRPHTDNGVLNGSEISLFLSLCVLGVLPIVICLSRDHKLMKAAGTGNIS